VTTGPRHRLHTGPADVTGYDCLVTERAGDGFMPELNDPLADRPAADPPRRPESDRVHVELQERMERLPPGHPSSPYNDNGTRKPPPLDLSDYELPIPGDPDYQPDTLSTPEMSHAHDAGGDAIQDSATTDDQPDQELPCDREQIGDADIREREELPLLRIADQAVERCREAEGRDTDGIYGERGLTPAMRRIEAQSERGKLVPETEMYALKSRDRFMEKLIEMVRAEPDKSPEELADEIHDGIRYTFVFDPERYVVGVRGITRELEQNSFELGVQKNTWGNDEYKGVNTRWLDHESGLRFEVQFHTEQSWVVKQQTHSAYVKIQDTSVS
jgi:hypothetical protein